MNATSATYAATPGLHAAPWGRPDPVRSRVHFEPQLTNSEILQADAARRSPSTGIHLVGELPTLPPDTSTPRPRRPHPGDVVYWVTCLGGVGLLLFAGTR